MPLCALFLVRNIHSRSPRGYAPVIDIVDRCPGAMPHPILIIPSYKVENLRNSSDVPYEEKIHWRAVSWGGGATQTAPFVYG